MSRTVGPVRMTLAVLLSLPGVALFGAESTSAAPTTTDTRPVITDYLRATGTWDKRVKNEPRGGLTTHTRTSVEAVIGYITDDSGRKRSFNQICVDIVKGVEDARGNPIDPTTRDPSDYFWGDTPAGATVTIASDLSSASVDVAALPLTHVTWICPDGPFGDCYTVESPGPVVSLHANWTAVTPVDTFTLTCVPPQSTQEKTYYVRDAASSATVDGVDAGRPSTPKSDISHVVGRPGCNG